MRHSISQLKAPQVLSHLLLVVAIFPLPHPCAIRFPRSNHQISTNPISSAFSGRYFSLAAPMCHWSSQVKSSNPHKFYLIFFEWSLFSFSSFYIIFLLCLPLCLSVVSPRGGVCNCSPSRAVKLWGRAVPSASPVRHNGCHRFPSSNRQISTSPISSAFNGRYFSLAAPMCH